MKKSIYVLGLGVAMMATSCESINNLLVVKVDTDFEISIPLETETTPLKSGNNLYNFYGEKVFDPLSHEDIAEVRNKIKEIAVNGIKLKFSTVDLDEIKLYDGNLSFIDSKNFTYTIGFDNMTIAQGAAHVDLVFESDFYMQISEMFTSGPVTVKIFGKVDKPGITMEAITTIASTVFAGL